MIRPAEIKDLDALTGLGARMHAESRFSRLPFDAGKVRGLLERLIGNEAAFLWVCERGGRIVGGLAAMSVERWFSPARACCDLGLFVDPAERGGMAAALLVKRYVAWALDLGIDPADIEMGVNTGVRTEETGRLLVALGARPRGHLYTWENASCA